MLVKLGDVWVDPTKVEGIYADSNGSNIAVDTGVRSYLAAKKGNVDDFAAIINNVGQSYGGTDETEGN